MVQVVYLSDDDTVPRSPLSACCGELFVSQHVSKQSFEANTALAMNRRLLLFEAKLSAQSDRLLKPCTPPHPPTPSPPEEEMGS